MGIVFGHDCDIATEERLRALEQSPKLDHQVLAENFRLDSRVPRPRQRKALWMCKRCPAAANLLSDWFEKYLTKYTRKPKGRVPECCDLAFNGPLIADASGVLSVKEYRQFMNVTKLLVHIPREREIAELFNAHVTTPILNSEEGYYDFFKDKFDVAKNLVERVLTALQADPTLKAPWGPAWLTPLESVVPDDDLERHLAQIGVEVSNSFWIELRYMPSQLATSPLAAPTVLDGNNRYWHPPVPPDPITYRGPIMPLRVGYAMDLRGDNTAAYEPLPELIGKESPELWLKAWKQANYKLLRACPKKWQEACGLTSLAFDRATMDARRERHSRFLARVADV